MSRLGIFIADGCEEVEALTVVDIVRRAKLEIDMISINGTKQVTEFPQCDIYDRHDKRGG